MLLGPEVDGDFVGLKEGASDVGKRDGSSEEGLIEGHADGVSVVGDLPKKHHESK